MLMSSAGINLLISPYFAICLAAHSFRDDGGTLRHLRFTPHAAAEITCLRALHRFLSNDPWPWRSHRSSLLLHAARVLSK